MHGIRSKIGGRSALALAICASAVLSGVAGAQLSDSGGAGSFPDPPEVHDPLWEQMEPRSTSCWTLADNSPVVITGYPSIP